MANEDAAALYEIISRLTGIYIKGRGPTFQEKFKLKHEARRKLDSLNSLLEARFRRVRQLEERLEEQELGRKLINGIPIGAGL